MTQSAVIEVSLASTPLNSIQFGNFVEAADTYTVRLLHCLIVYCTIEAYLEFDSVHAIDQF